MEYRYPLTPLLRISTRTMEPFSTAAAAVALLCNLASALNATRIFIDDFKNVDSTIDEYCRSIGLLFNGLDSTKKTFEQVSCVYPESQCKDCSWEEFRKDLASFEKTLKTLQQAINCVKGGATKFQRHIRMRDKAKDIDSLKADITMKSQTIKIQMTVMLTTT